MKVLYDYQIFDEQKFGGISRYFYELIRRSASFNKTEIELSLVYTNNEYILNDNYFSEKVQTKPIRKTFIKVNGNIPLNRLFYKIEKKIISKINPDKSTEKNKSASIVKIKEGNFDIFHPTYYDDYFLDYLDNKPYILTIYDLIHEIYPEFYMYHSLNKSQKLLTGAAKIIAISENTKKDLVCLYDVDPDKVEVTHLANSLISDDNWENKLLISKLPAKYLLFVGNRNNYKNFYFFAEVFKKVSFSYPDVFIVCTGSEFNKDEKNFFNKLGLQDKIIHRFTSDGDLKILYQHAIAFVFPSQYEGFGLPVLEAFSCGCPVLCSNTSSLSEIAKDAVVYFDPKNPNSLLNAVYQVLSKEELRKTLIIRGNHQLENYSWDITTQKTIELYKKCLIKK